MHAAIYKRDEELQFSAASIGAIYNFPGRPLRKKSEMTKRVRNRAAIIFAIPAAAPAVTHNTNARTAIINRIPEINRMPASCPKLPQPRSLCNWCRQIYMERTRPNRASTRSRPRISSK